MTVKHITAAFLGAAAIAVIGWHIARSRSEQVQSPAPQPVTTAVSAKDEDGVKRLGPFSIGDRSYVVVLHEKPVEPGSTQETGNTVVKMQIQDSAGAVQYERNFPAEAEVQGFSDAWFVSPQVIKGKGGSGLLIDYAVDSEPSAPTPEASGWSQLFGVVNGKLQPFSGPILVQGALLPSDIPSDSLEFKVWAHHFRLVFPVAVNWAEGKLSPAQKCDVCEYKVLPEDLSSREDLTFVRMCTEPKCEKPDRTVVKKESAIELIAGQADVHWSEGLASGLPADSKDPMADQGEISVANEVWLKVRIDGKDGWLHDDEDFTVLTLPFEP